MERSPQPPEFNSGLAAGTPAYVHQQSTVASLAPHDINRTGSLLPWRAIRFDLCLSFARWCLDVLPEAVMGRNLNAASRGTSFSAADAPARNCLTT